MTGDELPVWWFHLHLLTIEFTIIPRNCIFWNGHRVDFLLLIINLRFPRRNIESWTCSVNFCLEFAINSIVVHVYYQLDLSISTDGLRDPWGCAEATVELTPGMY